MYRVSTSTEKGTKREPNPEKSETEICHIILSGSRRLKIKRDIVCVCVCRKKKIQDQEAPTPSLCLPGLGNSVSNTAGIHFLYTEPRDLGWYPVLNCIDGIQTANLVLERMEKAGRN